MAQWMGMNPDEKKAIEWTASDKHFMQGWYEKVLHPMEKDGEIGRASCRERV